MNPQNIFLHSKLCVVFDVAGHTHTQLADVKETFLGRPSSKRRCRRRKEIELVPNNPIPSHFCVYNGRKEREKEARKLSRRNAIKTKEIYRAGR